MSELKIERGLPMPDKLGSKARLLREVFDQMVVGDSVRLDRSTYNVYNDLSHKEYPKQLSYRIDRSDRQFFRVWRIADDPKKVEMV